MGRFKTFNQWVFKGVDQIEWFDKTGLIDLDQKFVALNLDYTKTNYYDGHLVEVYNKQQGLIFKKKFRFKDYMIDVDVTNSNSINFSSWGDVSEDYIFKVSHWGDNSKTKKYTDAILRFLEIILYEKKS